MASPMRESGNRENVKVSVYKFGLMDPNTWGNGKTIRPMGKEHFITQMVIFMKDNG
jgi:hypothetical protein